MHKCLVDRRIIDEIGNKLVRLSQGEGCFFSKLFRRSTDNSLREEALVHSYKIEFPGSLNKGSTFSYNSHPSKKPMRKGLKDLNSAFVWGMDHYNSGNFSNDFIRGIAGRIESKLCDGDLADYRTQRIGIKGASWEPVLPSEIEGEMEIYYDHLRELLKPKTLAKDLEAAAYSHLHLDRIHPFLDGNGRTARTVQTIILLKNNLPPAIISPGERFLYYNMLQGAIEDWKANGGHTAIGSPLPTSREVSFYNYIAGKVSTSLDRILDNL
jgi:hypothetical protein